MTMAKVYSNKALYEIFSRVVTKRAKYSSAEVAEAIRIRRRGIDIDAVVHLLNMTDHDLKAVFETMKLAEKVGKKTDTVPLLCDIK